MERDPRSLLWDVRDSADTNRRFTANRSIQEYLADDMLRSAVERHFEIIGEALRRLEKERPDLAASIPDLRSAIGLRNVLIHGYATIDNPIVWRTAQLDLPRLRDPADQLLGTLGEPEAPPHPARKNPSASST